MSEIVADAPAGATTRRPPPPHTPQSSDSQEPSRPPLNREQLLCILRHVASRAFLLNHLLNSMQQGVRDEQDRLMLLDAAQMLVSHIGGMADEASGSEVYGDATAWQVGPVFAELGKAGAA